MWLFGLVFVAIALHLTVGRFFVNAARKRRTRYVLTDKRAVVIDPSGVHQLASEASRPVLSIRPDYSHIDVVFGHDVGPMAGLRGAQLLRIYANTGLDFSTALGPGTPIAFYDVADVEGLEAVLTASTPAS